MIHIPGVEFQMHRSAEWGLLPGFTANTGGSRRDEDLSGRSCFIGQSRTLFRPIVAHSRAEMDEQIQFALLVRQAVLGSLRCATNLSKVTPEDGILEAI